MDGNDQNSADKSSDFQSLMRRMDELEAKNEQTIKQLEDTLNELKKSRPANPKCGMTEEHEALKKRLADIEASMSKDPFKERMKRFANQPLAPEVLAHKTKENWTMPKVKQYCGKVCPFQHIVQFDTLVSLYPDMEPAFLKMFRGSLSGNAFSWYNTLPAGSISTWEDMKQKFCRHYDYLIEKELRS